MEEEKYWQRKVFHDERINQNENCQYQYNNDGIHNLIERNMNEATLLFARFFVMIKITLIDVV